MNRDLALTRLAATVASGRAIIGGGAGTGHLREGGRGRAASTCIIIYNSGRYRMAGRGSLAGMLAYGDANAIVMEMAARCCPS